MFFVVEAFQSFFDGKVAHKNSVYMPATVMHEFGGVHIIFGLNQPFFGSLFHKIDTTRQLGVDPTKRKSWEKGRQRGKTVQLEGGQAMGWPGEIRFAVTCGEFHRLKFDWPGEIRCARSYQKFHWLKLDWLE